jgi:hypothetical protein
VRWPRTREREKELRGLWESIKTAGPVKIHLSGQSKRPRTGARPPNQYCGGWTVQDLVDFPAASPVANRLGLRFM